MSLVGYRTHSITLRAANMRRGVLVNSAVCRRFVFFRGIREISIAKAGPVKIYAQNCLQAPAE